MIIKLLEVRDRGTFIPVFAFRPVVNLERPEDLKSVPQERYLLRMAGFNEGRAVIMGYLRGGKQTADPYDWSGRTMPVAHDWVTKHFDELSSGDVIDVEFILGETTQKKTPQQLEKIDY